MGSVLVHLGVMLGHLGFKLRVLWQFWLQVGASWSHLDSNLGVLGVILEAMAKNIEKSSVFRGFWGGARILIPPRGDGERALFA